MAALTEKQRQFVHGLFLAPRSHGSHTFAARAAGYGTPTSSRKSLSSMAHALMCDPKIQAAIAEVTTSYLTTLGPAAVRALRKVLSNDKHKDHGRAIGIVMDRVTPVQSTAVLKVEHEVGPSLRAVANVTARILELAERAGVPAMIDVTPAKRDAA
jgi:phage terminase small subunit